jgi:hypothetical protein
MKTARTLALAVLALGSGAAGAGATTDPVTGIRLDCRLHGRVLEARVVTTRDGGDQVEGILSLVLDGAPVFSQHVALPGGTAASFSLPVAADVSTACVTFQVDDMGIGLPLRDCVLRRLAPGLPPSLPPAPPPRLPPLGPPAPRNRMR